MKAPSSEWTQEERIDLIWRLGIDLQTRAYFMDTPPQVVGGVADRLIALALWQPQYLEQNRARILEGLEFEG